MKRLIVLFTTVFLLLSFGNQTLAQTNNISQPKDEFVRAKVLTIKKDETRIVQGMETRTQLFSAQLLEGEKQGQIITIESGKNATLAPNQIVTVGETVILEKIPLPNDSSDYQVYDVYRINSIYILIGVFFLLIILATQRKSFGSILGLMVSLGIIVLYVAPQILKGGDPLTISVVASFAILFVTTYLAHGFSKQTTIALAASGIALLLTVFFSWFFAGITNVTGFNEQASTLQFGPTASIDVKGLLLGGIIIGTLGALNDITTTQTAAVFELAKTNPALPLKLLFLKGFLIGREHIVSMINTLVLAYAGTSMALFLFITLNPDHVPFWVILNTEDIADEIVRTIAGSMGLILVVPIVTLLAAYICLRESKKTSGRRS